MANGTGYKPFLAGDYVVITENNTTLEIEALPPVTFTFGFPGVLVAGVSAPFAIIVPASVTILWTRAYAVDAPVGANAIFDVHKNGTTIFTTQGNRPIIADGTNLGAESAAPDVATAVKGDVLIAYCDQIGSGTAGSYVTLELCCRYA